MIPIRPPLPEGLSDSKTQQWAEALVAELKRFAAQIPTQSSTASTPSDPSEVIVDDLLAFAESMRASEAGVADDAVAQHVAQPNPHPQYLLSVDAIQYSRYKINADETVTIPEGHALLVGRAGLQLDGTLVVNGLLELL